jgi:hypothetical protein
LTDVKVCFTAFRVKDNYPKGETNQPGNPVLCFRFEVAVKLNREEAALPVLRKRHLFEQLLPVAFRWCSKANTFPLPPAKNSEKRYSIVGSRKKRNRPPPLQGGQENVLH